MLRKWDFVCVCVVGSGKTDSDQQIWNQQFNISQFYCQCCVSRTHPYVLSQCILVSLSILLFYSTVAVTNVVFYSLTVLLYVLLILSYHPTLLVLRPTVSLSYFPTVLLSYCPTVLLSYCLTVLLSYFPTVLLSYCLTVLLSYCPTVSLSYCLTVPLSYCPTVLVSFLLHYIIKSHTMTSLHI